MSEEAVKPSHASTHAAPIVFHQEPFEFNAAVVGTPVELDGHSVFEGVRFAGLSLPMAHTLGVLTPMLFTIGTIDPVNIQPNMRNGWFNPQAPNRKLQLGRSSQEQ